MQIPHGLPSARDAGPFSPPTALTELREKRPVSPMVFPDGHKGWLVTGYDEVRAILADRRFSSRLDLDVIHVPYETPGIPTPTEPSPTTPGLFIAMDPPEHTRLRRKLTGAFTVKRMRALETHIDEIVRRQIDHVLSLEPPVDLVTEFTLPVPSLVICEILGIPYADRDQFQANAAQFMVRDQTLEDKMAALGALTSFLGQLVVSKRNSPQDDLLSELASQDDLGIDELVGIAFLLLLAGHETTANMLALGTFALLENPGQLALLRAEPALITDAVEELLRYLAVADIFFRYATEDVEIGGETIGAGCTVVLSLATASRDARKFTDGDELDLRRYARGHLAFGHGVHQCLGQQLARIEMRAGFSALLRRLPGLELAIPAEDVILRTDMSIYGVHELPVTWR